jgi:tetratricopeptide (TPR) repeat protein
VLWLHASNSARFYQSLRDIANQLKICDKQEGDRKEADLLLLIQKRLRRANKEDWLIVLDNADDADFLLEPPATSNEAEPMQRRIDHFNSEHGSMIITTRSKREALKLVHASRVIEVGPMSEDEAEALLEDKLGHASMDNRQLAVALECMPLAITQAAAYILEMGSMCSVKRYHEKMERSRKSRTSLLRREVPLPDRDSEASNSVLITWQISFEHILNFRKSAADLLSLMSFCDRLAIPETLLQADINDGEPSECTSDFDDDIVILRSFLFISDTTSARSWQMHRLVQDATQAWLCENGNFEKPFHLFVHRLWTSFPTGDFNNWPVCETLFPHARSAVEHAPVNQEVLLEWASLMYNSAWYASEQGNFLDALKMATASMEVRAKELGEEDKLTLRSTAMVAGTNRSQGQWKEAEMLEVKVMETTRTVLGAEHPSTLTSMANLASTYRNQGRWKEAEELEVKVMETSRMVLGAEHPSTLTSMNNLASTYWNQGRWEEAEELDVKVMETSRTVLGAEHPDTLASMNNLASTYRNQGRWKEAEELDVKVMQTSRTVLGAEHPDTLASMNNLASTYWNQGRWEEAEELFVKVIETRRTVLGAEHPDTLTSMANLASTYSNQGRWKEAEELFVKVMETRRTVLGAEHPSTLTSMNNLASTYRNQGRWKEAEELDVKVMQTSRTVLGAEHPDTLASMNNLASTYWNQGRWEEAEELFVKVMETRRTVLGAEHPDTLTSMANLAFTLRDLGRRQHALSLITSCVDRSLAVLGVEHPDSEGYTLVKTHWEKEDSLLAEEEADGLISDKPVGRGRRTTQLPSNFSIMFLILAGVVVILAICLRQHIG